MHKRSLATAVLCGGLRVAAAHSATNCTAAHSALVAFGEAVMTFKPRPATPVHVALPLAAPAAEVVQAVGGAELNVAVALSRVSAAPIASYVSVLPHGPLGDAVRSAAEASGVATENVVVDGSPHSVLGTLHVVDDGSGPRPHYQRHHSAFATVASGDTFDWPSLLSPAKWLHVTGITPLLGPGPAAAWSTALEAAAATDGCDVSLDFNHRPALGSLEELWALVQPHVAARAVTLLMLSEDSLRRLAEREGVWPGEGAEHASQAAALSSLRQRWGVPLLGCCFKRAAAPREAASGGLKDTQEHKNTLFGGGGVVRWSVVATAAGEVSTGDTPVVHRPREALGGGDAWVAGFLHGLLDAGEGWRGEAASSRAAIARACRRGDLLAALSMARFGDLSDVSGGALRAAEARWAGVTAQLNASGAGGGGVVVGGGGEGASGAAPPQRFAPFHAAAASVFERFGRTRLVPVVSLASPEAAEPVARALLRGGVDVMELVLRTPSAMQALRLIASKVPEMAVGAGTVLSAEQAEQAVAAGASFLVSPGTNPRVVEWATQRGVPIVPGCATASEIEAALELGLTHLKFFPAEASGGAAALKALGGPYKDVRFMPTGGVTQANLPSYLSLPGVFAAGGTWLVPAEAVAKRDWAAVEALTRAAVLAAAEAS